MGLKTNTTPSNSEAERIYNQLCSTKEELDNLGKEITYKTNQLSFLFKNSSIQYELITLLGAGYMKYHSELSKMTPYNLNKHRGHYTRCNNERKDIVACLSRLEQENKSLLRLLNRHLGMVTDSKKYSFFKKRIKEFEELVINKPVKIVESCFNALIVRPEHGTRYTKEEMDGICLTDIEIIDNIKQLKYKKLGTFVDDCTEYGAIDKENGQFIITPAVSIYTVELAEKYKMFQFVK